ncbi:carboxylesterase family protein [Humisphaera borealis]|uniref:Uncharacterized protein n=1 Tax=Humisphaera borealis TaxID=2807512 RepID=A0A7M2WSH7_9BACT|nr:hypothetical protein [Humisphaera borealis]QOV88485.1 hypothetical protein IPV69_19870 [Humisphaera borealis]
MLSRFRAKLGAGLLLTAFVSGLIAAPASRPSVAVPPPVEPPPTTRPAWPPIPKEALVQLYQKELGDRFRPQDADRYHAAHELIERYFEAATMADRKAVAKQITAMEVDPVIVGRLCRIRMFWPALDGGGIYYVNQKTGIYPTHYFFGLPKAYDRTKSWPLVLKLPTAHAFLVNPPLTAEQVTDVYKKWIAEEQAAHPDAIVVMPLLNLDELWGPSYAGSNAVLLPMQHVASRANVDPARVYIVGHNMSAHAAWNLALHYTTYFAAINPLAGGASQSWQRIRIINLKNVLPVVWHDADDTVVKVEASRGIVKAMRIQKVDVEYDETKGIGHAPDAATAERAYQKMRARVRELYPKSVALQSNRPDTMFNRNDWLQVYQAIDPGEEHKAVLRYGSGTFTYFDNPVKAEATITGQKIDIKATNVDSLRLYVNDQMIDIKQPITVTINGRPRAAGAVVQSIDELLADQLFLGRGWRYYTGIVDIGVTVRVEPTSKPSMKPATRPTAK